MRFTLLATLFSLLSVSAFADEPRFETTLVLTENIRSSVASYTHESQYEAIRLEARKELEVKCEKWKEELRKAFAEKLVYISCNLQAIRPYRWVTNRVRRYPGSLDFENIMNTLGFYASGKIVVEVLPARVGVIEERIIEEEVPFISGNDTVSATLNAHQNLVDAGERWKKSKKGEFNSRFLYAIYDNNSFVVGAHCFFTGAYKNIYTCSGSLAEASSTIYYLK